MGIAALTPALRGRGSPLVAFSLYVSLLLAFAGGARAQLLRGQDSGGGKGKGCDLGRFSLPEQAWESLSALASQVQEHSAGEIYNS